MRELLNTPRAIALSFTLGLGMTACSSEPKPQDSVSSATEAGSSDDFAVHHTYTESGKRITEFDSTGDLYIIDPIVSYCDGPDLVDRDFRGASSEAFASRTEDHAACADRRLTAADFE
ncbi:hypothetical protein KA047_02295 [Candidatus Saccharibacteria bacterium]|nr:hypothetical protein [Candidatus Saccharibacteria bacterium]